MRYLQERTEPWVLVDDGLSLHIIEARKPKTVVLNHPVRRIWKSFAQI